MGVLLHILNIYSCTSVYIYYMSKNVHILINNQIPPDSLMITQWCMIHNYTDSILCFVRREAVLRGLEHLSFMEIVSL